MSKRRGQMYIRNRVAVDDLTHKASGQNNTTEATPLPLPLCRGQNSIGNRVIESDLIHNIRGQHAIIEEEDKEL
jgi:hypothetical protein